MPATLKPALELTSTELHQIRDALTFRAKVLGLVEEDCTASTGSSLEEMAAWDNGLEQRLAGFLAALEGQEVPEGAEPEGVISVVCDQ